MKNILIILFIFSFFSCQKEETDECCTKPIEQNLVLFVSDNDQFLNNENVISDSVYLFDIEKEKKVKRFTFKDNRIIEGKERNFFVCPQSIFILPFANQEPDTFYLKKLNNQIDTFTIKISEKKIEGRYTYILDQLFINGKDAQKTPFCFEDGFCYWLP